MTTTSRIRHLLINNNTESFCGDLTGLSLTVGTPRCPTCFPDNPGRWPENYNPDSLAWRVEQAAR